MRTLSPYLYEIDISQQRVAAINGHAVNLLDLLGRSGSVSAVLLDRILRLLSVIIQKNAP